MNCSEVKNLIPAYLDGELDAAHNVAMEKHLRECTACARIREGQQTLKSALGGSELQFKMPAALRRSIVSGLRQTAEPKPRGSFWWSPWFAGATTAAVVALSVIFIAINFNPSLSQDRLAGEITSSHVRSLMANHLMDVASTDQHTVKPWFDGKLNFAPPVKDLVSQGFPLTGGRLDYIDGHSAAALVFMRQKHVINLFIWPSADPMKAPGAAITRNGYHLVRWAESGMTFWAVSDLNEKELVQFAETYRKN